jgi:hypothetical protein
MSLLLGLRLAVAGGREALLRLAFTAAGVGIGLTMLLLALAAPSAVDGRGERTSWHDAAYAAVTDGWEMPVESADRALFLAVSDYYDGTPMLRAYVAALGADPPVPPGLDRLPGPGEVAVSPAMRELLESTPDDQLDDRFPGRVTMTIGEAGLEHDNELVVVVGRTPEQLREVRSMQQVTGFSLESTLAFNSILTPFVMFGAVLVLAPVALLVVMVTRVAAAQREQRLAAIRLAGATRLQAAVVAAAETGLAAVVGAALAWVGYEIGRRVLAATVVFQGGHFWLDDLTVPPGMLALVLAGAPVFVMLVTISTLRRVQTRPLAMSRRGLRAAPSAWGAVLIVAGIGGTLALAPLRDRLGAVSTQASLLVISLTVVGLMLLGPRLCVVAGEGIARLSRGVPGLIAARRIAADPRATFRTISGVVLAVTAVTYLGSTTVPATPFGPPDEGRIQRLRPGVVVVNTGGVPAERVAPLLSDQTVTLRQLGVRWVVPCEGLARMQYNVSCPHEDPGSVEPGVGSEDLMVSLVFIPTDGSLAVENRVRTQAANLVPNAIINTDRDPVDHNLETLFTDVNRLITVAGLFVLLMGAFGLTAGMVGGLLERRRPFALLRASGMRLGELRQIVFLETAATMVLTSAIGVGLGLVLAYVESTRDGGTWAWPDPAVFGYVGGGVLAALVFSTLALPLLNATTRHDAVRYE